VPFQVGANADAHFSDGCLVISSGEVAIAIFRNAIIKNIVNEILRMLS